jgi:hypothetical protein
VPPHQTSIEFSGVGHLRRKIDVPFVAQQAVKFRRQMPAEPL